MSKARVAFVGLVITGTELPPGNARSAFGGVLGTVRVEQTIRGLPSGVNEVQVNPLIGTSCYYALLPGERWLILGGYDEKRGIVTTGGCSGSRQILPGEDVVDRIVSSFLGGPNLFFGSVHRYKGWNSRWQIDNFLSGVEVQLHNELRDWSAKTDEKGYFEVSGLPAGEYRFEVQAPGLSAEAPDSPSAFGDGAPATIRIPEKGCVEAPVMMWPDQAITGVLREAGGAPVAGVKVAAYALDERGKGIKSREATSGSDGQYVLPRLPEGTYIVGVNGGEEVDNEPYRMTFYPAAHTRAAARKVTVSGGSVSGIDLILDRARKPVRVTIRSVFADNQPASFTRVMISREDKGELWVIPVNWTGRFPPRTLFTDNSGQVVVELFEGDEYTFSAERSARTGAGRLSLRQTAPPMRAVATPGGTVTLRLSTGP